VNARTRVIAPVVGVLLAALGLCAAAQAPDDRSRAGEEFARGVAAYGERRYEEAAARFEAVRELGLESGELYYDLGSAYYRLGDAGRAILSFRRAERFLPRDPDLRENLAMALERARERLPEPGDLPWQRAAAAWRRSLALHEEKALFLAAYVLAGAILLLSLVAWTVPLRRIGAALAVVSLLLGASYGARLHGERSRPPAVVIAPQAEVRTGPGEDYSVHFLLHAGAELRVEEQAGEWAKIVISAERKGWLRASTIERL
jgi:tetratricopeptide (TPR) repeat protein